MTYKATGERALVARDRLQSLIDQGRANAAKVIEQVKTQVPQDALVKAPALKFYAQNFLDQPSRLVLTAGKNREFGEQTLHRNAMGQAAQRASIPMAYVETLREAGQFNLLADNFNERFHHKEFVASRFLTRSVNGEVRGFLSDRYKRMESWPLVKAFTDALERRGALPYQGYAMDTKISIQAILPELYEPVPGEVIAFGAAISNSDFGNGALNIRDFVLRLLCINGALGEDALRKVHLGARLNEDDFVYSDRTVRLDQSTVISMTSDITERILQPEAIEGYIDGVRDANSEKLDARAAKELLKRYLLKGETEKAIEAYNSPDVEMLPAGNTVYRLSNAVSWLANSNEVEPERKLELQQAAGEILRKAA